MIQNMMHICRLVFLASFLAIPIWLISIAIGSIAGDDSFSLYRFVASRWFESLSMALIGFQLRGIACGLPAAWKTPSLGPFVFLGGFLFFMLATTIPGIIEGAIRDVRVDALDRTRNVATQICTLFSETGTLPERLETVAENSDDANFRNDPYSLDKVHYTYASSAEGFLLVSVGPDLRFERDPLQYVEDLQQNGRTSIQEFQYDPTNGTVSGGDLILWTPRQACESTPDPQASMD